MKALLNLVCILSFGFFASTNNKADIYIKEGSQIVINGKSNINHFSCDYEAKIAPGCQIVNYDYHNNTFSLKNAEIKIKSQAFDCGGRLINKDFNELMQSDEHPHIVITLTKIKVIEKDFEISTKIEIAGETNQYTFIISQLENHKYVGKLDFNIEDFGMKAPRKLLGAIQVNPNISINFDMNIIVK